MYMTGCGWVSGCHVTFRVEGDSSVEAEVSKPRHLAVAVVDLLEKDNPTREHWLEEWGKCKGGRSHAILHSR